MAEQFKEKVEILDAASNVSIELDATSANISAGGHGHDGDVIVRDSAGQETIRLNGNRGDAVLGGSGHDGDVIVREREGRETIRLDGSVGNVVLGGNGQDGDVIVRDSAGQETIRLNGEPGIISLRGHFIFTAPVATDEQLPSVSTEEGGAEIAFQGSQRAGLVDFTVHTSRSLRSVWIFNPELTDDSIVFLTTHYGNPCGYNVEEITRRHSIFGGIGKFISVRFIDRVPVGDRVRIKYYIIN